MKFKIIALKRKTFQFFRRFELRTFEITSEGMEYAVQTFHLEHSDYRFIDISIV